MFQFTCVSFSYHVSVVMRIRIRCLFGLWIRDPVHFWPLDPGSGMNNPDRISESLETIFLG